MSQTLWIGEERGSLWVDVPPAAGAVRERASRIARRRAPRRDCGIRSRHRATPRRAAVSRRRASAMTSGRLLAEPVDPDGGGSLSGVVLKGRFVLKQPIGRGATGVVDRAFDRSPGLHPAQIAVKVLHEGLQREQVTLARVRHDFAVSQSLEHPNIVKVFDFYRDDAHCFYTMELVDGESLRRLMDLIGPEPMSLAEVSPLIRDMGAALAHAHRRDIVHGDFKPENVVVTRNLAAKVLDFGLARAAHAVHRRLGAQAERDVTLPPAYASSEVLEGNDPGAIDDVYSFACVCYELLAGHLPFGALDALAARDAGLEPVRIDGLSDAQWRALSRALALRARDRTSGVEELIAQLGVDGGSPSVGAPAALPRAESRRVAHAKQRSRGRHEPARSRRPRRSRPWLVVALLAGIALVLGVVYLTPQREARLEMMALTARDASEPAATPALPRRSLSIRCRPPSPPRRRPHESPTMQRHPPESPRPTARSRTREIASSPSRPRRRQRPRRSRRRVRRHLRRRNRRYRAPKRRPRRPPQPRLRRENADASSMPADASPASATAAAFAFPAPQYVMSESKSLVSIPIERKDGRGPATDRPVDRRRRCAGLRGLRLPRTQDGGLRRRRDATIHPDTGLSGLDRGRRRGLLRRAGIARTTRRTPTRSRARRS